MTNKIELPKLEEEILKKMWFSCSQLAANALSEMINRKVLVSLPLIKILRLNEVPRLLNPEEISITIFFIKIKNNMNGVILLSSPLKHILKMADIFLKKEMGYFKDLSDENLPVLKELSNILCGYFIDAFQKLFNKKYSLSEPYLSVNPFRVIEEFEFDHVYIEDIYGLVFATTIKIPEEKIEQKIVLVIRSDYVKNLLDMLSEKVKLEIT
ncbi:MAG: hypothetical protein QXR09_01955 [Candidatus Aenigmatarchaeota archaeon]